MKILAHLKGYFTLKILSPYLIFTYFYLRICRKELGFNVLEITLTYVSIILLILGFILTINYTFKKNHLLNSFVISILLFILLFFEEIYNTIKIIAPFLNDKIIICSIIVGAFIFIIVAITKNLKSIKFNFFLNTLFIVFCSGELYKNYKIQVEVASTKPQPLNLKTEKKANQPNIYILIIDGYTSNKSLKKYWNFDNKKFSTFLTGNGFKVYDNSKSNYYYTIETMASMFNYDYIDKTKWNRYNLIKNDAIENRFISIFKQNGYLINNLSLIDFENEKKILPISFFAFKKDKNIVKVFLSKIIKSNKNFINILKTNSNKIKLQNDFYFRRKKEELILKKIDSISNNKTKKKLVISHNLLLHPPYDQSELNLARFAIDSFLLNSEKPNFLKKTKLNNLLKSYYLNEIISLNLVYTKVITSLLKKDKNTIIIILGDHGFRFLPSTNRKESNEERYTNFMAILIPKYSVLKFPETLSPINAMRLITNETLGTKLELLVDKQIPSITNY